ncbi:carboxypeptidase regulatory-like domain-containing protein [Gemmatimonas sp.]|uniref:carboxypeptidase-like regulatory domain-containing protein n=1 Tax=Gemmatimonas sp. TaxID=1962908 RepID=UPI003DA32C66
MLRRIPLLALLVSLLALLAPPVSAQQLDVIRGRITGQDNEPLENVSVLVTSISGNVNRTARTDRAGRFTVTFPNGDGDYMVTINAVGFAQRRFEVKRAADEDVLLADAKLSKVGTVLDAMRVTAERQRVSRGEVSQDIGGTERTISNLAALPPDQMGDLAAMAATLPGVQLVPGQDGGANGFSVLGLGADQNNTTLNGMMFGGAGLPRDAGVLSSLITSPYDVSRGGFSGGQFQLRTRSGTNFSNRGLSFVGDAPQLQWTDAAARATGQEYTNGSLGGTVSGPLVFDKAFYNVSYQLGRRSSDLQSLLNTSPSGLQASGVSADSVSRLLGILGNSRVPINTGGIPGSRLADQGSLLGAIDFAPPSSSSGSAYNLTVNAGWNKQNPAFTPLTTALPNTGAERTSWNGGLQGRHSGYFTGVRRRHAHGNERGLQRVEQRGHAVPQPAGRPSSCELYVCRRHERCAAAVVWWQSVSEHHAEW